MANVEAAFRNIHQDLIDGCKTGDQKAQFQIYKLYYKSIYGICLQVVNDPVAAEDIMHESFLSAFENISTYCGKTSFWSWLNEFVKKQDIK